MARANASESIVKRGTLALLKDSRTNRWEEANAVVRPPYLHLHPEPNKRETQVINLSQASVVASPDVETLLGVSLAEEARSGSQRPQTSSPRCAVRRSR